MDLSPEQVTKLQSLGLNNTYPVAKSPSLLPLFSISGITLLSIGGLILLKNKDSLPQNSSPLPVRSPQDVGAPTQVPKSIQHYLLTSQQAFSQALTLQQSNSSSEEVISYLNQSILAASEAIKTFPSDYRAFEQRAKIYQSLTSSQPQYLNAAISDYQQAQKLNPSSADLTRQLASLFSQKGDLQNTLNYLSLTTSLEPTKAQNFYDLALLQQQAGLLPDALKTYNELIPLITDSAQKIKVETEKNSLEKIVAQNHITTPASPTSALLPTPIIDSELLQASNLSGLIIAAPQNSPNITLKNQTDSNSLSGTATLLSQEKQIVIQNSRLTSSSQVYLTLLSGGKNQSLELLSKTKDSFTVGFLSPISEDVTFKWWIVNP